MHNVPTMKYFKWPGGQNTSEGHTKNSSFGQETLKYADVFAFNLLKKKPSFIKCILNLRFLKTGLLSEFQLYVGLMNTLTSSVYHCFHGNGSVNGILAQSSIHHYRSRNQSRQKLPSGPHTPFHSSAIYTGPCTAYSFAKNVFNVFFKESSVAAKDQSNGPQWLGKHFLHEMGSTNPPV